MNVFPSGACAEFFLWDDVIKAENSVQSRFLQNFKDFFTRDQPKHEIGD